MTGGDPFAPTHTVAPKSPRSTLHRPPHERLRRLGASSVVLAEVERRWKPLDQAERRRAMADFDALSDDELSDAITDMEVEAVAAKAWPQASNDDLAAAGNELPAVPGGSVKRVMGWVGDSAPRALAALVAELREAPNQQRSTLIEAMEAALHAG